MSEINLTQSEADLLLGLEKYRVDDRIWNYPPPGGKISIPLVTGDKREEFMLDIHKGRIDLLRGTYQNRTHQTINLARLDFGGSPHRNPDGEEIPSPHIHMYKEGYGDKWAYRIPLDTFPNQTNLRKLLDDFMAFCNIVEKPVIQLELFS